MFLDRFFNCDFFGWNKGFPASHTDCTHSANLLILVFEGLNQIKGLKVINSVETNIVSILRTNV